MPDTAWARQRSKIIQKALSERKDERLRKEIKAIIERRSAPLDYKPLHERMISHEAWDYVIGIGLKPWQVFAHEDVLKELNEASMYYRGIALLSKKEIQKLASNVDNLENSSEVIRKGKITKSLSEKIQKVTRVYNCVISAMIMDSTDWSMENGYRNIIATMSISLDGTIRNKIGKMAEDKVRKIIMEFAQHKRWLLGSPESQDWISLFGGFRMKFGSEPDVEFQEQIGNLKKTVATIEIKGGTDPAGALERLGAMKKSFDETSEKSVNFLILGVSTESMDKRLEDTPIKKFILSELDRPSECARFLDELFHHAVRISKTRIAKEDLPPTYLA